MTAEGGLTIGGDLTARTGTVVVLGSMNMDLVVAVPHVPRPGETVLGSSATYLPGGKGANQAVTAARLGGDVVFIGRSGDDDFGAQLRSGLRDAGVHIEQVGVLRDTASGVAFVVVDEQGENTIVVSPGANSHLSAEDIEEHHEIIASSSVAIAQLETPLPAVQRFAQLCHRNGIDLLLNAAPYRDLPAELLRQCTFLVVNREEARLLTGISADDRAGARRALAAAADLGPRVVIITLGDEGCILMTDGEYFELDAYQIAVVDSTGAGDAFVGALGVALAGGQRLEAAVRFAAAAGAVACRSFGGQRADLSADDVRALMAEQPVQVRPWSDVPATEPG